MVVFRPILKMRILLIFACLSILCNTATIAETHSILPTEKQPVGERPYEMVNAGRDNDIREAFLDFENLDGWVVETTASEAEFRKSRRQQLWGDYVGHLKYRGTESDKVTSRIVIKPPKPMPIPQPFDSFTFWVYGNNWEWERVVIPRVQLILLCESANGETIRVPLDRVRWKEWFLVHHKFQPETLAQLGSGAKFVGIEVNGGTNAEFAELFFDNLAFYLEELKPLTFAPRPKRPLSYPEGQTTGTNTGPGVLPFPTREETILPGEMSAKVIKTSPRIESENAFVFGIPGLTHYYCNGNPFAASAECGGDHNILAGGGLDFGVPESEVTTEVLSTEIVPEGDEQVLHAMLRYTFADKECLAKYTIRQWNNSLVVDVEAKGGLVRGVKLGKLYSMSSPEKPVAITVPYLTGYGANRPRVTMIPGNKDEGRGPIFHLATIDHTRSNGSEFYFSEKNSGVRYLPKTDGTYNDCYERIFVTMSPKFADVLPNVPNPVSQWRDVTGSYVWRALGATDREQNYAFWKKLHRYGLRKVIINDHESGWRDGGESFTFRTYTAPKKGGDASQLEYAKKLYELGFYYGPYNNYTDYAPVNAYWNEDWVTRLSNGQWRSAWARCYNPKPQIAVEAEREIAEIVQQKFGFNTAYCDVHTAVTPWQYVDYDHRVPGAGTLAATFFAYGEIMLHQKQTWRGPVYSEGNNHWYYCGLTDGNYGQDQAYFVLNPDWPWLVDFDLLKLHPLGNHFGMGDLSMFYGQGAVPANRGEYDAKLDRFIAATIAFGHSGFLDTRDIPASMRSYFLTQGFGERVGTQNVKSIRYIDENDKELTTELALESGAYKLNRIRVEYEDGLVAIVNGNPNLPLKKLPPNSFAAVDPSRKTIIGSSLIYGTRFDYAETPDTIYGDGRGQLRRFGKLICDGPLIILKNKTGPWEIIPVREGPNPCKTIAFELPKNFGVGSVVGPVKALNQEGNEIGEAECRQARNMLHIFPKDGEFSYLFDPTPKGTIQIIGWGFDDLHYVVPGMLWGDPQLTKAATPGTKAADAGIKTLVGFQVPDDAEPGTIFWRSDKGNWYDFIVLPLCDLGATFDHDTRQLTVDIRGNFPYNADYLITLKGMGDLQQTVSLLPDQPADVVFVIDEIQEPGTRDIAIVANVKDDQNDLTLAKPYRLVTEKRIREDRWSPEFEVGSAIRGGEHQPASETSNGSYARPERVTSGGDARDGWAAHPPYIGGVGYVSMFSEPLAVRANQQFRAAVGIRDGGDQSDGIAYKVIVVEENNTQTEAASVLHKDRQWAEISADLSPWAGKKVRLLLITDVGPNDNSSADWACWADLRLCGMEAELISTLQEIAPSEK